MTRVEDGRVGKRQHFFANRPHEPVEVPAGQIRATDRALEDHVTDDREALVRRPVSIGGVPLTIQSVAQVAVAPPTFAVRVNRPREIHFSYTRYLVNALRQAFGFTGSPIRLAFRQAAGPRRRRLRR